MKKMELKIAITFAIIFVVRVAIEGIYSAVALKESFLSFDALALGMFSALVYLGYVWCNTRKHQFLATIGFVGIGLMVIFICRSVEGVPSKSELVHSWNWRDTVCTITYIVAYELASKQGEELLKEDEDIEEQVNKIFQYLKENQRFHYL